MPSNVVFRVRASSPQLQQGLQRIAEEQHLPGDFPAEVLAAAEKAAAAVVLPELDRTDIPFLTIDPAGSMDLDQAMHLARDGEGYVVHYAIADVAAFVTAGDPIDQEARRRGETLYGADTRIPLHPPTLSENAASLLPDQVRPALLWTIGLDHDGAQRSVTVERARVRSTARWSYVDAQAALDGGTAPEVIALLKEIGQLREKQEVARGGVSLPLPEQEITAADGSFSLSFREQLPVELWNAQISLLTGMAAAGLMVEGKVGMLRTLPPPDPRDVERLRRVAQALKVDWPTGEDYPAFIRGLDPKRPAHQAMTVACTRLLRGSGYTSFDGALPEQRLQSAVAAEYAHVTAPLRRLGDRYVGEVCIALSAGRPVPDWARNALPDLPKLLEDSGRRAHAYERAVADLVEAGILTDRVGQTFDGTVTSADEKNPAHGVLMVPEVGVEAPVTSDAALPVGQDVRATLAVADVAQRRVEFRLSAP
ncbi:MAG TPA: RNB domain-containing ribonuclease [Nocardioides sp.]|nr:RNB domain-containing ribonuclease [Nocardioides sp.]